jgi:hypothetical protein
MAKLTIEPALPIPEKVSFPIFSINQVHMETIMRAPFSECHQQFSERFDGVTQLFRVVF